MPATARGIRSPLLTDTANVPRDIGYAAADVEAWLARTRHYTKALTGTAVASGTVLGALVIPAQPLACRVKIRIFSQTQASAAAPGFVRVVTTASSGTLAMNATKDVSIAANGSYSVSNGYGGTLDLAASTASTLTFTTQSSSANDFYVEVEADIWYAGEYA